MTVKVNLVKEREYLLEHIDALKKEILNKEPTLDDIFRFIQENHPKKQEQYSLEQQLRQAQNELASIDQATEQVVL